MSSAAACTISLPLFEGPLDLLLYLVERQELDIYQVHVASVAAQYLAHLRAMRELDLDLASEFYLMAVRLVAIKAQALLPQAPPEPAAEDAAPGEDPGQALLGELAAYQACRRRAELLGEREAAQRPRLGRVVALDRPAAATGPAPCVPPTLPAGALLEAFTGAAARAARRKPQVIAPDKVTVRRRMAGLLRVLRRRGGRIQLAAVFPGREGRREFVSTFLAVLELIRRRIVRVSQDDLFGEMSITLDRARRAEVAQ